MIQSVISEFGKKNGIKNLALSQDHLIKLAIEDVGDLYIEEFQNDLIVMLVKELEKSTLDVILKALTLCHYRQKNPFVASVSLFETNKLVFSVLFSREDFTKVNLDKAIEFLHKLHQQLLVFQRL